MQIKRVDLKCGLRDYVNLLEEYNIITDLPKTYAGLTQHVSSDYVVPESFYSLNMKKNFRAGPNGTLANHYPIVKDILTPIFMPLKISNFYSIFYS